MDNIICNVGKGYTSDQSGYSGSWSWWRSNHYSFEWQRPYRGEWFAVGHETSGSQHGFATRDIVVAVTDDFGNLVRTS